MKSMRLIRSYLSKLILLSLVLMLGGCFSAASLRCAVEGDSSFVELYNVPQNFSQNVRAYGELCGFAYEGGDSGEAS